MANSIQQDIEELIPVKENSSGNKIGQKRDNIDYYEVGHDVLRDIQPLLVAYGDPFVKRFFNRIDGQYLIWDHVGAKFKNEVSGEDYAIRLYYDDFEGANNWTFVNGAETNTWNLGTADPYEGANSMYVSSDGGVTNNYDPTDACIIYSYQDFVVPVGSKVFIKMKIKSIGLPYTDFYSLFAFDDAGVAPVPTVNVGLPLANMKSLIAVEPTFFEHIVELPSNFAGGTIRIAHSWVNNNAGGANPPANIDNFELLYI